MERERNKQTSLLMLTLVAGLLSQSLLIPVMSITSVEDQKNYYYSPDPHPRSPPTSPHRSPPSSHGTPSHGSPPSNCGNPPSGGHYHPKPSPPRHRGGGSYSPPTYGGRVPPTTPYIGTPPISITPPSTPTPYIGTPPISITPPFSLTPPSSPTPPFAFEPNSPPFTCNYWRTHPGLIWGLLGWWGTMGGAFGTASIPGFGSSMSLQQALSNPRTDGFGELYREGTASLLNSMVDKRFPFTTKQVRDSFVASISSNKAAAAQARLFKLANEGKLKPRA